MRAALTDSHTNREALHPSGFHPHESRAPLRVAKDEVFKSYAHTQCLSSCDSKLPCHHPTPQETEALCSIRVSASTPYAFTGYGAAVIKVPFQHSTHHDLFHCKHSLSQLNPRPLYWDINGHFKLLKKKNGLK